MNNWKSVLDKKSADYRPLTFWSWNNKLDNNRLKQQINELKQAGFGGFFMHARYGLKTEYLSDEWYSAIECCMKEAKEQGMSAWCYDENGYPSGFAGMKLLDNPENLARYLTLEEQEDKNKNLLCSFFVTEDNKLQFNIENNIYGKTYYIYENSSPATVDIFNKRVVDEFIELTHEEYYKKFGEHFGTLIEGFFTDEPQYYRYSTPYSPCLEDEYEKLYGEKLIEALPYLFLELDGYKKYRWRYYKLLNDLYTNTFIKTVFDWCKAHNCKLTGHTIEECLLFAQMRCCAGVMPFYEYEDIPGCDWLGRNPANQLSPKQVGSVAQQLGKKQTLTESFACTGWDANPRELKRLIDWQYANGINLLCTHLTPYSMEGCRKYDHPAHFSSVNPMFSKFSDFSKYITNLGCMIGESKELANVGVIHPIHSAYLTYNRKDDDKSIEKLEKEFDLLLRKLQSYNIPYHLIDETLLNKYGKVSCKELIVGLCNYDAIVIPSMEQIDKTTADILKEYVLNGGRIYIYGQKPNCVSGEEANLDFLNTNIEFDELKSDIYYIDAIDTQMSSVYRSGKAGDFLFVYNHGQKKEKANYYVKANSAAKMDLVTGEVLPLMFEKTDNGYIKIATELDVCESQMILFGDYEIAAQPVKFKRELKVEKINAKCIDDNILILDTARFSYDGKNYSKPMYIEAIQAKLLQEHYCGKIYLRYTVIAENDIDNIVIEAEKMNCTQVNINNQRIFLEDKGIFDPDFVSAKILSGIVEGENNIDFCIDYYQNDHVYEVLDNLSAEVESLVNCLVYDTELAPVCLYGSFSVRGQNGYFDDKAEVFCYSNPFVLSEKNDNISNSITTEGFPFYAGRVEYNFEVTAEAERECLLKLNERFSVAHIKWNNYETDLILSDNIVIPSKYVKTKNFVTVTVMLSNRNRLGPHHWADNREPLSVWTSCFNMSGTWDNGESKQFNPEYAFVKQAFSVTCYSV